VTPNEINPALNTIVSSLFRVSAKLLVIQDDKLLVVHEAQGWYGLPGGGVDHGESIIEGLVREISEEIGYEIEASAVSSLPSIIESTSVFEGVPRLTLVYEQTSLAPRFTPQRRELDYKWITPNELTTLPLAPNIAPMRKSIIRLLANTYKLGHQ